MLEKWEQEDFRWIYDTAAEVCRLIFDRKSGEKLNIGAINAELARRNIPVTLLSFEEWGAFLRKRSRTTAPSAVYVKRKDGTGVVLLPVDTIHQGRASVFSLLAHELTHRLQHKKSNFGFYGNRGPYYARPEEMIAYTTGGVNRDSEWEFHFSNARKSGINQKAINRWRSTRARYEKPAREAYMQATKPERDREYERQRLAAINRLEYELASYQEIVAQAEAGGPHHAERRELYARLVDHTQRTLAKARAGEQVW